MASGVLDKVEIVNGPGELDLMTAFLRGGDVEITLKNGKRHVVRIKKRDFWDLTGDMIELLPGVLVELKDARYSPHSRAGEIIPQKLEKHPVCEHLVVVGQRYCSKCGADRMSAEE